MKLNKPFKNILVFVVVAAVLLNFNVLLAEEQSPINDQENEAQPDVETAAYKEHESDQNAETSPEYEAAEIELKEDGETEEVVGAEDTGGSELALRQSLLEVDDNTVIVYTYKELANALSNKNGYTYIYLGRDIIQSNTDYGIIIHSSKASIVIDGRAPGESASATFTQRGSSDFAYTIHADNNAIRNISLRNMTIIGRNYYGAVSVADAVSRLSITYENISYTGPQITYNRQGSAHYINSTIHIISAISSSGSAAQEVAEASDIAFSGEVTISSETTTHSMFWLTGSSTSMTVNPGARVIATTKNCLILADGSYPDMTVQSGASLTYAGQNYGLLYDAHRLKSLHLFEDSELRITQANNITSYGTLRIASSLQADPGSTLYINSASSVPAIQLVDRDASITFRQPKRVMLYTPSGKQIAYLVSGSLHIAADAVNIWKTSKGFVNDNQDNAPTFNWNRGTGKVLEIDSTFSVTTQKLSTNLKADDPTTNLNSQTFAVGASQMLVFGRISLDIDPVYTSSKTISGTTALSASLRAYNMDQNNALIAEGMAEGGAYTLAILKSLKVDDNLSVSAYDNYLRMVQNTIVQGSLSLTYVPASLDFENVGIPEVPCIVPRSNNSACYIEIEDTRSSPSGWTLLASLERPLSAEVGETVYTLNNGLVYIDVNDKRTVLSTEQTQIASGAGSVTVTWQNNEGILVWADPSQITSKAAYTTTINWSLQDAP